MNEFYIGDDVHLARNPETKGRVHHMDGEYVWIRINEELIPFLNDEVALDDDRDKGYILGCLTMAAMILVIMLIVTM